MWVDKIIRSHIKMISEFRELLQLIFELLLPKLHPLLMTVVLEHGIVLDLWGLITRDRLQIQLPSNLKLHLTPVTSAVSLATLSYIHRVHRCVGGEMKGWVEGGPLLRGESLCIHKVIPL